MWNVKSSRKLSIKRCTHVLFIGAVFAGVFGQSCGGSSSSSSSAQCKTTALTGTPWSPQATGLAATNHDASVVVSQTSQSSSGQVTGLAQGISGREVSFTIDMTQDLGQYGSLTLMAQSSSYPSQLQGSAFAYLTSLNDGTNEYVNLSSSCRTAGLYTCSTSTCAINTSCTPSSPSAFFSRDNWEQNQGYSSSAINYPSVNIFPSCNWSSGSPACAFNSTFFPSGVTPLRLRYGVNYTAKYALIADSYATLTGYSAGLTLKVLKKVSNHGSVGGAVDLNVFLVGTSNIQASRTTKGQQNLNTMISNLIGFYGQSTTQLKIGTVTPIEWPCATGGDQYASVSTSELGTMFANAKNVMPSGLDLKAVNVFLVSSITDDSSNADSNLTILGVDGAIGGPALNGTAISGVAVSSFNSLATFNSSCSSASATCAKAQQDSSFYGFSETVAHETGHYFRLNHLSESSGTVHDPVPDTPICTATQNIGGSSYITINSCINTDTNVFAGTGTNCSTNCGPYDSVNGNFCPTATACEFNYAMWWTTKNFSKGNSDGDLFSPNESAVISYHPLVQ